MKQKPKNLSLLKGIRGLITKKDGDPNDPDRIACDKLLLQLFENNERYLEHFNDLIHNEDSIKEGLFRKQLLASWNDLVDNITNKEFAKRMSSMEKKSIKK